MALITAHELHALAEKEQAENLERIEKALNKALSGLKLQIGQNVVEDLYVPGLNASDQHLTEFALTRAGYADIRFITQLAEYQTIDVHISFVIPPR